MQQQKFALKFIFFLIFVFSFNHFAHAESSSTITIVQNTMGAKMILPSQKWLIVTNNYNKIKLQHRYYNPLKIELIKTKKESSDIKKYFSDLLKSYPHPKQSSLPKYLEFSGDAKGYQSLIKLKGTNGKRLMTLLLHDGYIYRLVITTPDKLNETTQKQIDNIVENLSFFKPNKKPVRIYDNRLKIAFDLPLNSTWYYKADFKSPKKECSFLKKGGSTYVAFCKSIPSNHNQNLDLVLQKKRNSFSAKPKVSLTEITKTALSKKEAHHFQIQHTPILTDYFITKHNSIWLEIYWNYLKENEKWNEVEFNAIMDSVAWNPKHP